MLAGFLSFTGAVLAALLTSASPQAQSQPLQFDIGPGFEVASIKSNTSGGARMRVTFQPGGRMVAVNAPVTMLLVQAFLIPSSRTIGAPAWTRTSRFDIDARANGDPPPERMRLMARSLLVDRFKLKAHVEMREEDGFALVRASASRELGPQMRKSSAECAARATLPDDGNQLPVSTAGAASSCETRADSGSVQSGAITMTALAQSLSFALGSPVVDATGLVGDYALTLTYDPERQIVPGQAADNRPVDGRVSVFTAIQEQLGLKLEPRRAPVEFLVIDQILPPSEN